MSIFAIVSGISKTMQAFYTIINECVMKLSSRILTLINTQASRTEFHNTLIYNSIESLHSFAYS